MEVHFEADGVKMYFIVSEYQQGFKFFVEGFDRPFTVIPYLNWKDPTPFGRREWIDILRANSDELIPHIKSIQTLGELAK